MNPRLTFRRLNWKWSLPGLILVALLAAFFNPPDPGVTSGEFEYVQRVVDGDTLLRGTGERVRLIGVNTPETVHPKKAVEAFGKEASAFTKRMVEGKLVRLEFDPLSSRRSDGKDRYSRTLAYVFLQDGTHLNKLVKFGSILEDRAKMPKERSLISAMNRYQELSARQTTDVSRREERQTKFIDALAGL